jgi:hypothetical protein
MYWLMMVNVNFVIVTFIPAGWNFCNDTCNRYGEWSDLKSSLNWLDGNLVGLTCLYC